MMSRFVNRVRLEMEQLEAAAAPGAASTPSATQLVASGLGIRIAFGQGEPPTQPPAPLNDQHGHGQGQGQGGPADIGDIEAGIPSSPTAALTIANGSDSGHSRAGGESAAQAAARQRLAHPESLDMAHIAVWVDGMLPYLLLFIVVFLNTHFVQLIQLVWLFACLLKVNPMVRKAWTKQEDALHQALMGMAYIVVSLWACLYLTGGFPLLHCLSFLPLATTPETVTITLMTVGIVDCIARLLFALVKLPILLACRFWPKDILALCGLRPARTGNAAARARIRQQGALLSLIDMLANFYRMLLPVQFWYLYLLHRSDKYPMIASSLTGLYVTRKGVDVWQALWKLLSVLRNLWQTGHSYGRPATREDILTAGNQCPICQDTISGGLRLSCNHCFCEDCIAEWLERDTTCPMCRTQVKAADTASSSSDQALAMSLLPRLF